MSNQYSRLLDSYLDVKDPDRTQAALADAIQRTQASVSRYAAGRLPDAETARKIERATQGHVPFAVWQTVAAKRFGITPQDEAA